MATFSLDIEELSQRYLDRVIDASNKHLEKSQQATTTVASSGSTGKNIQQGSSMPNLWSGDFDHLYSIMKGEDASNSASGQAMALASTKDSGQEIAQALTQGSGQGRVQSSIQDCGQGRVQTPLQDSGRGIAQASAQDSGQGRAQTPLQNSGRGRVQTQLQDSGRRIAQASIQGSGHGRVQIQTQDVGQERVQTPAQNNGQRIAQTSIQDSGRGRVKASTHDSGQGREQAQTEDTGPGRLTITSGTETEYIPEQSQTKTEKKHKKKKKKEKKKVEDDEEVDEKQNYTPTNIIDKTKVSGTAAKHEPGSHSLSNVPTDTSASWAASQHLPLGPLSLRNVPADTKASGGAKERVPKFHFLTDVPTDTKVSGVATGLVPLEPHSLSHVLLDTKASGALKGRVPRPQVPRNVQTTIKSNTTTAIVTEQQYQGRIVTEETLDSGRESVQTSRQVNKKERAIELESNNPRLGMLDRKRQQMNVPSTSPPSVKRPRLETNDYDADGDDLCLNDHNGDYERVLQVTTKPSDAETGNIQEQTQTKTEKKQKTKRENEEQEETKKNTPTNIIDETKVSGAAARHEPGLHSCSNLPARTADASSTVERNVQGENEEVGNVSVQTKVGREGRLEGSEALNDESAVGPSQSDTATENESRTNNSSIGLWDFTCLLFNLGRNNKKVTSTYENTPEIRMKLLQPILDKQPDAIFFQETNRNRRVLSELTANYLGNFDPDFGVTVLLKKSMFEAVDDITKYVLQRMQTDHNMKSLYTQMVSDGGDVRMCFCKAVPLGRRNDFILMASYHGRKYISQTQISNRKHHQICTNLLKICQYLQKITGARHMLIGGDFNVSEILFSGALNEAETTLTIEPQRNPETQHRKCKDIID